MQKRGDRPERRIASEEWIKSLSPCVFSWVELEAAEKKLKAEGE